MRVSITEARRLGIRIEDYFTPEELQRGERPEKGARANKYNAERVEIDGFTFDSKKEADYYYDLKLLHRAGEVVKIEVHPVFVLQPGYRRGRKKIRDLVYEADFRVTYANGRVVVVDVKGYRTKEYLIKKKLLLARYPEIDFIEA